MFSSVHVRSKIQQLIAHLRSYPFLHEKGNADLCANILQTVIDQHSVYSQLCHHGHYYAAHFIMLLGKETIREDDVFSLLEDLLILVREKTLRTGIEKANCCEQQAIEHVVCGSLWTEHDGTLFSDAFFHKLPLSIIQSISLEAKELTETAHLKNYI